MSNKGHYLVKEMLKAV